MMNQKISSNGGTHVPKLLYSVTVNIQNSVREEWLRWMMEIHIPEVMATGCFEKNYIREVVFPEPEDDDSATFNISYVCAHPIILQEYLDNFASDLQNKHSAKYEGKFVAFRTVLKDILS